MKEEKLYNQFVNRLKKDYPILENPDDLTNQILHRIETQPVQKRSRFWLVQGWLSGVAATILLFIFLTEPPVALPSQPNYSTHMSISANISLHRNDNLSFKEEIFLKQDIMNERRETRLRRNALHNQLLQISNVHSKTNSYENK